MQVQPEHRSILAVDIEGFGRLDRTDPIRLGLHRQLRALLERALTSVGIPLQACELHDTGDGFIVSISSQVPKTRLLDPLPASLARRLARYNRTAPAARRLRLRLVVHAGEVLRDPQANVGDAVIFACRLLDAQQLRACLAATDAPLVVGVSEWIYTEVVRHGYGRIDPAGYQPVGFASKDTAGRAWVHVPGDPDAVGRAGLTRGEGLPSARGGGAMGLTGGRGETEPPVEGAMLAAAVFQLPAGIGDFTGRAHAVRGVVRRLAADHVRRPSAVAVCAIVGKGGVGKTTLAVQVAHKIAARFPDGQLYVNLRGVEAERLDPAEVLADLLRALGVAGSAIPDGLGERARRYRSRLAGRRVLVVLDNAADEAQVRPLLPGDPGCAVLVTSRARLAALEGAHTVDLDVLDPDQAVRLLGKIAGLQRVTAEPDHARAIVRRCGFLPLAIRIAGARLAARPHWPLAHLADQLADTRRRLDVLTIGDLDVRASVTVSYTAQDQEARRLFAGSGCSPARTFPPGPPPRCSVRPWPMLGQRPRPRSCSSGWLTPSC